MLATSTQRLVFFSAGITTLVVGCLGVVAGVTLRPSFTTTFHLFLLWTSVWNTAFLFLNICFLNRKINLQCAATTTYDCDYIRTYYVIIFSIFTPLVAVFTPILAIMTRYLYRTTRLPETTTATTTTTPIIMENQPLNTTNNTITHTSTVQTLRRWNIVSGVFLSALGVGLSSLVYADHLTIAWGLFTTGIIFILLGILGVVAGITQRPTYTCFFSYTLIIASICLLGVLSINLWFFQSSLDSVCVSHTAQECKAIRNYDIILFSTFTPLIAFLLPIICVIARYHYKLNNKILAKQEFTSTTYYSINPTAIGNSNM